MYVLQQSLGSVPAVQVVFAVAVADSEVAAVVRQALM
jgi:hypothetical protein